MLPGLTRTAAHPASIAANTYLGWKWMSAMTGIWDFLAITPKASASSWLGTATRTMSQPVAVSSAICCSVALTSAVRVVVIDCTLIGASPPTATLPTLIWRLLRRGARVGGGRVGRPKSMLIRPFIATYGGLILAHPPENQPNVGSGSEEIPAGQLTRTPSSQSW